jgi:hypothetical protein
MDERSESPFIHIKDADGKVTGIMDRMTAEYLASTAPYPTQSSLDTLLNGVSRVRVVSHELTKEGTKVQTLCETSEPADLAAFRECFAIVEDPKSFGHCMCLGDPHLELYSGESLVATIGYHHGRSMRWNAWKSDALFREPMRLLDWMSAHGVTEPRRQLEEMARYSSELRSAEERWMEAIPDCLRPLWERMEHDNDPAVYQAVAEVLKATMPDAIERASALFGWFGCGMGPWSGYPSYETIVEDLLLEYPTQQLIDALVRREPTNAQWLGAARYFSSWGFGKQKKKDRRLLPAEIKQRLLEAARSTADADNIMTAESRLRD